MVGRTLNGLSICSSETLQPVFFFFWLIMIVFLRRDGYNDFNTFYMQVSSIFSSFLLPNSFMQASSTGVGFGFRILLTIFIIVP